MKYDIKELTKVARKYGFKDYKGGAAPEAKTIEVNNFALFQALFAAGKMPKLVVKHWPNCDPEYITEEKLGRQVASYNR